jgi:23S rRNA (guanosine2251-2'-O)-methyltransferase
MSTNRNFYKKAQREQNRENRKADAAKKVTHKYDGDKTGKDNYKADYVAGQVKDLTDEDMRRRGLDLEGARREENEVDTDIHSLTIEGRNAVLEAIRSGKTIDKLFILDGCQDGPVSTIRREATKMGIMMKFVSRERLDQISDTGKHQGVIAYAAAYDYAEIDDIFALAEKRNEKPFIILLDNIEDPHNLGAIIRTANIAGAHGVIIPKNRAVGLTATVAKASAGALNYTPVVKVTNIAQTIEELKKRGVWFVCADMDGQSMYELDLTGPIGLVIGNEGSGVSRLVSEKCDMIATIPMKGEINSLNASVAAGVLAYEIVRQRLS